MRFGSSHQICGGIRSYRPPPYRMVGRRGQPDVTDRVFIWLWLIVAVIGVVILLAEILP